MGVNINIRSIEEVPEVMREFVSESDGAFVYDADKAFKALVEERNGRRADRKELAAFKAIGLAPDELAKYKAFGKTPEEISELIEKASRTPEVDPEKLTEAEKARLLLEKEFREYRTETEKRLKSYDEMQRKAQDAERRQRCEELVSQLPDELDKDRTRLWLLGGKTPDGVELQGFYRNLSWNAIGDLDDVGGLSPLDYLAAMGNTLGFKKSSTPGNASPGNATLNQSGANAEYLAAKQSGDVMGMLKNAPEAKITIQK